MRLGFSRCHGWLGLAPALSLLVACSGSSVSLAPATNATAPPGVTPSPTPRPTATPTSSATDNTFAYAGSLTQTFTLFGTPAPLVSAPATPAPTATPWVTTLVESVTQNASVAGGASFKGRNDLTKVVTLETDTSVHETTTTSAQTYLAIVPDATRVSGIDVTEAATTSSESSGVALATLFASGNGIVGELPFVPNARWANTAARTDSERDPDGQISSATYAADGTYTQHINYPQGGTAAVETYGDGSGVYQMPIGGESEQNSTVTVSAPVGSVPRELIPIAYSVYGAGLPGAGGFEIPDWYPGEIPALAADTFVDEGAARLPASCGVSKGLGSGPIDAIVETKSRLDTLFGEFETDRETNYESAAYGVLCRVIDDDVKNHYDFSVQSDSVLTFSSSPLYLTSASVAVPSTAFAAVPSDARVRAIVSQSRGRMLRALAARARSRTSP